MLQKDLPLHSLARSRIIKNVPENRFPALHFFADHDFKAEKESFNAYWKCEIQDAEGAAIVVVCPGCGVENLGSRR
jgi:hypothetical protein